MLTSDVEYHDHEDEALSCRTGELASSCVILEWLTSPLCAFMCWPRMEKEMDWEQWFSKTLHQGLCIFTKFPSDSNIHQSLRTTDLETGLIDSKGAIQTYFKPSTCATRSKHCLIWADSAKLTPGRSVFFNQSAIVPAVDLLRGELLLSHVPFCWVLFHMVTKVLPQFLFGNWSV